MFTHHFQCWHCAQTLNPSGSKLNDTEVYSNIIPLCLSNGLPQLALVRFSFLSCIALNMHTFSPNNCWCMVYGCCTYSTVWVTQLPKFDVAISSKMMQWYNLVVHSQIMFGNRIDLDCMTCTVRVRHLIRHYFGLHHSIARFGPNSIIVYICTSDTRQRLHHSLVVAWFSSANIAVYVQ